MNVSVVVLCGRASVGLDSELQALLSQLRDAAATAATASQQPVGVTAAVQAMQRTLDGLLASHAAAARRMVEAEEGDSEQLRAEVAVLRRTVADLTAAAALASEAHDVRCGELAAALRSRERDVDALAAEVAVVNAQAATALAQHADDVSKLQARLQVRTGREEGRSGFVVSRAGFSSSGNYAVEGVGCYRHRSSNVARKRLLRRVRCSACACACACVRVCGRS